MKSTPVYNIRMYDNLPAVEAVVAAWTNPGNKPEWHHGMRDRVAREMPLLARALDRLARDYR